MYFLHLLYYLWQLNTCFSNRVTFRYVCFLFHVFKICLEVVYHCCLLLFCFWHGNSWWQFFNESFWQILHSAFLIRSYYLRFDNFSKILYCILIWGLLLIFCPLANQYEINYFFSIVTAKFPAALSHINMFSLWACKSLGRHHLYLSLHP